MRFKPVYDRQEQTKKQSDYAVVIPVINEGERIHALLERMSALNIQHDFDVIIVDGGSTDGSLDLEHLKHYRVNTLLRRVSPGALGTQLQCAYHFVSERNYKGVITIDGNNKDDPEAIQRFRKKLECGFDFVQGSRFVKGGSHENTPLFRLLAVRLIHAPLLSISSGFRWTDTTQGFRGYSKRTLLTLDFLFRDEKLQSYDFLFSLTKYAPKRSLRCTELGTARIYPKNEAMPTKISPVIGSLKVLLSTLRVAFLDGRKG